MFKISRLTDYSVVILASMMATRSAKPISATDLADSTGIPQPTVAKILKLLVHANILASQRGMQGGYSFCKDPETLSIAEVITALDGPVALTACVDGASGTCLVEHVCALRGRWDPLNSAVQQALENVSLKDIANFSPIPDFVSQPATP